MTQLFPKQCFRLDKALCDSISQEEIYSTYDDMIELDIAQPPYPNFDLMLPGGVVLNSPSDDDPRWATLGGPKSTREERQKELDTTQLIYRFEDCKLSDCLMKWPTSGWFSLFEIDADIKAAKAIRNGDWSQLKDKNFKTDIILTAVNWYRALLVVLATKNTEKTIHVDKLAKQGIGRAKRHVYTTTISVGKVTEIADEHHHTGRTVRPHLRRGHIRRQHFGPQLQFVKQVFIQPVFVNADDTFMDTRTAYNVSKRRELT